METPPRATITPDEGEPERANGWKGALIGMVGPAFYAPSWAPWVRMLVTATLMFIAVLVWRWTM